MSPLYISQKRDFKEETNCILSTVRALLDDHTHPVDNADNSLQVVFFFFFQ